MGRKSRGKWIKVGQPGASENFDIKTVGCVWLFRGYKYKPTIIRDYIYI